VFFPRYNFGLNLNLFNILTQGEKNRISRREIVVAQEKVNRQMRETRAETLSRYASYKLAQRIYEARALVEQELNASFLLVQQLYKTDEKTLEDYTKASSAYFQAQEARMEAETEVQLTRIRLEEIIGLKWDQVQHPAKD
jgi:outer membrane protein TolC